MLVILYENIKVTKNTKFQKMSIEYVTNMCFFKLNKWMKFKN